MQAKMEHAVCSHINVYYSMSLSRIRQKNIKMNCTKKTYSVRWLELSAKHMLPVIITNCWQHPQGWGRQCGHIDFKSIKWLRHALLKHPCRIENYCDFLNVRCAVFLYQSVHIYWHQNHFLFHCLLLLGFLARCGRDLVHLQFQLEGSH